MKFEKWNIFYNEIAEDLDLDKKADINAAYLLQQQLEDYKQTNHLNVLKPFIFQKKVFVFGAGPSLESSIQQYASEIKKATCITADGATSALLKQKIIPQIIVTDLDGYIPDQIKANEKGSKIVIHAHADNTEQIQNINSLFQGPIIGTTQVNPDKFSLLFNVGGFTDGDRSVYLADHFQAKKIYLIGFDYHKEIGLYSFAENKNKQLKKQKLKWCDYLIKQLENPCIRYLK